MSADLTADWYELWDVDSGNYLQQFDTLLEAAHAIVRMEEQQIPLAGLVLIPTVPTQEETKP